MAELFSHLVWNYHKQERIKSLSSPFVSITILSIPAAMVGKYHSKSVRALNYIHKELCQVGIHVDHSYPSMLVSSVKVHKGQHRFGLFVSVHGGVNFSYVIQEILTVKLSV